MGGPGKSKYGSVSETNKFEPSGRKWYQVVGSVSYSLSVMVLDAFFEYARLLYRCCTSKDKLKVRRSPSCLF